MEASRVLAAKQLTANAGDIRKAISNAFRLITCRTPQQKEIDLLEQFYQAELTKYRKDLNAATTVLKVGTYPQDNKLNKADAAAMMLTVQTIYNLDETISRS